MRTRVVRSIFLVVMALVLVGCSSLLARSGGAVVRERSATSATAVATTVPSTSSAASADSATPVAPTATSPAAVSPTPVPTTAPSPTIAASPTAAPQPATSPAVASGSTSRARRTVGSSPTTTSRTATAPSDAVIAAIKAVIQKANNEQQQAFAKGDPTIMQDTATSQYYNQLVQINQEMAQGGVSAIKLIRLEWGPITIQSPTVAQATTFETWQTTYSDGSVDQSRDRNDYTLVQQQGVWKIQSDVQPTTNLDQPPAVPSTIPGTAPATSRTLPAQSDVSSNWSGYSATGGTYTGVSGTWIVPESTGTGNIASSATWVGIGGVSSRDLIQAGTEDTSAGNGRVSYDAWIETLPQASHRIPLTVHPGDSVSVSIQEQGNNQWLIAFKNNTTGETYQTSVQYQSSLSSAEWIEEAPSARRQLLPLDNFGTVQFTNGTAIKDGKTVTIAQAGAQPITMIDYRGDALATPSSLNSAGTGFSISRSTTTTTPSTGIQPRRGRIPGREFYPNPSDSTNPFFPLGPSFGYGT